MDNKLTAMENFG